MLDELGYPQYLLIGLVCVLVIGTIVAGTTSGSAFGGYNPSWDGTTTLRGVAADSGADATIATNVSEYTATDPTETIAVILSPDTAYSTAEAATVREFLTAGGTVVVAEDIGPHTNPLLNELNASTRINGTAVRDERSYYQSPALPVASNVTEHELTTDMEQLTLNHPSYLDLNRSGAPQPADRQVLVSTSGFTYADRNSDDNLNDAETLRARPVVTVESVGDGTLIVIADPSVFINSMLGRGGNRRFTRNLIDPRDTVLLDYSHQAAVPPLIEAQLLLQRTPLLAGLVGLLLTVGVGLGGSRRVREHAWVTEIIETQNRPVSAEPDPDALAEYLRSRHPDWDAQRLEHVMEVVLVRDMSDTDTSNE